MQARFAHAHVPSVAANLLGRSRLSKCSEAPFRRTACKCAGSTRSYAISSAYSKRFSCLDTSVREFRDVRDASLKQLYLLDIRRRKSGRAKSEKQKQTEPKEPVIGDDPPLYDKNPGIFGRWAYFLLALDLLFTGISVDMVMRNWTQRVRPETATETSSAEPSKSTTSTPTSPSPSGPNDVFVLRPLWHRLSLAGFELAVGIAAGAFILASRDRIVWRLRVQRLPVSSLPPRRPGMRPAPTASSSSTVNVLNIESASGKKKRFLMQDCILAPGRDLMELVVTVKDMHANFALSLNRARVLGHTLADVGDSAVLKELAKTKVAEDTMSTINTGPGADDPDNVDICNLRKALAHGWAKAGGYLKVPRVPATSGSWTSGPVADQ